MISLHAQFEISTFTHYLDMESDKNAKFVVVWGLGVILGQRRSLSGAKPPMIEDESKMLR